MADPKPAGTPVDTERVIRELLDAFKSLKGVTAPTTCSLPQAAAVESSENLESSDSQIEAESTECGVIEGFCRDHGIIERLRVTPQELQALSEVSLLGSLTCTQDALFVLRQVRSAMNAAGLPATVRPESLQAPYDIRLYDSWIAELVRRESKAKLTESDSLADIDHRNPPHRFVVVSLVLVSMAILMAISIAMC